MEDLINFDSQLSNDEIQIRDLVKKFVDQDIKPTIQTHFENGMFPLDLIKKISQLGLFGMTLPSEYGGSDASYVAYGLVCQELEKGDSGLRSFVSVQSSLCMYPIYAFGTQEQKEKYLKKMSLGEIIGCFGLTESDSGSDPSSMRTTAKKTKDGWVLNGSKYWITNGNIAHIGIIWAKTEEGIRGFIVEKDFEGFRTNPVKHKWSLRASDTAELVFDNCFIPDDNLLVGTNKGLGAALKCLTQARYGIGWGAMGAAMDCYQTALDYTKNRIQFDKPIASFQLVQKDLVSMASEIVKAQCLNLHIGRLRDKGNTDFSLVSLIKRNSCYEALKIARMARNLLGGNGISLEYPIIRHMNNLETVFTYEGTDNIHTLILGQKITGLNGFA